MRYQVTNEFAQFLIDCGIVFSIIEYGNGAEDTLDIKVNPDDLPSHGEMAEYDFCDDDCICLDGVK